MGKDKTIDALKKRKSAPPMKPKGILIGSLTIHVALVRSLTMHMAPLPEFEEGRTDYAEIIITTPYMRGVLGQSRLRKKS